MQNSSINERVSYLEAKEESHSLTMEEIKDTLHSLDEKVGKIEIRMEKSMSFWGGIAFTFSFLGGVLALLATAILRKVGLIA